MLVQKINFWSRSEPFLRHEGFAKRSSRLRGATGRRSRGRYRVGRHGRHSIDLLTALRLADAGNLQMAFAREQIEQSFARVSSAEVLWLPSLRGGSSYNKHEGQIQDTAGNIMNTSRNQFFSGFGAGANAAASPMFPGVYANFQLADAVFQPLAERQAARGPSASRRRRDQ